MNSFSNMKTNDKTFGSFQIKRNQETIDKYNNSYKDTTNSIDSNMFEQTYLVEQTVEMPTIDYDTNRDAQKQITIQKNKTNVLADTQNFMDANTLDETNPILHDGKLRQEQRNKHVRLQEEVDKVLPGLDDQTITQRKIVKEINGQVPKEVKKLVDNRHQYIEKPINLEESKKIDTDRHVLKQTIDNTMKVQYDLNNFQGKGNREHNPEKRIPVVPNMGFIQQQQTQPISKPEILHTRPGNDFGPNIQTRGPQSIIPYSDVNIARIVSMPKDISKFVLVNTRGKPIDFASQPVQSLETTMPGDNRNFVNRSNTLLTTIKHIFGPKPMLQQNTTNTYIHQATNLVPQNKAVVPKATDMHIINTNQPQFHELATQNVYAQNRGIFNSIYLE